MRKKLNGRVLAGLVILSVVLLVALLAPVLAPHDPYELGVPYLRPSAEHPLGTNDIGQDILSELIYGTRISLLIGVVSALAVTVVGTALGILSGYLGGWTDRIIMQVTNVAMALPSLPLTIILVAFLDASVWNIILARTYFKSIPHDLYEAAMLDGASDIQYFFKVLLPVCKPIIMVLFLYQFVGMWNGYFDAMIYLEDQSLQPLQLVIRSILVQNTPRPGMVSDAQNAAMMAKIAEQLKYSTIVISSLPLLAMYPFFQKYFEKGVMMGSVKG